MNRLTRIAMLALVFTGCASSDASSDWVDVKRDSLILGVDIEGTLEGVDSDVFGPPVVPRKWNFKLSRLALEGEAVERGAMLMMFDGSELRQQLMEKQNEYEAAKTELEKKRFALKMARRDQQLGFAQAEAELRKFELKADQPEALSALVDVKKAKLEKQRAESNVVYLKAKVQHESRRDQADIAALRDKMKRAQERVQEIQDYIGRMTVKAPRAGTVIYKENWRGEKKKVGDSVYRGRKVLEVVSLDRMKAKGTFAELHSSRVAIGQPATLRLNALQDVEFSGKVSAIAETVQRKSPELPLLVVGVEIALDDVDSQRMRPGMRFRGKVETGRVDDALVIPIDAVFIGDSGPIAYRSTSDGYEVVKLKIGARNQTHVQVLNGLKEGDRVSLTDQSRSDRSASITDADREHGAPSPQTFRRAVAVHWSVQ